MFFLTHTCKLAQSNEPCSLLHWHFLPIPWNVAAKDCGASSPSLWADQVVLSHSAASLRWQWQRYPWPPGGRRTAPPPLSTAVKPGASSFACVHTSGCTWLGSTAPSDFLRRRQRAGRLVHCWDREAGQTACPRSLVYAWLLRLLASRWMLPVALLIGAAAVGVCHWCRRQRAMRACCLPLLPGPAAHQPPLYFLRKHRTQPETSE